MKLPAVATHAVDATTPENTAVTPTDGELPQDFSRLLAGRLAPLSSQTVTQDRRERPAQPERILTADAPETGLMDADEPLVERENMRQEDDQHPVLQALFAMLPPPAGASRPALTESAAGQTAADVFIIDTPSPIEAQQADSHQRSTSENYAAAAADKPSDPASQNSRTALSVLADSSEPPPLSPPRSIHITPSSNHGADPSPPIAAGASSSAASAFSPPLNTLPPSQGGQPIPGSTPLAAPLGSPEWQQSLGQQLVLFTRHGQQNAELRLHPQELGALQISLKVEDGRAQLHVASANGQVRVALEAALPHLRSALAESGIQLGQSSIGSDTPPEWQSAQQDSQQHHHSWQRQGAREESSALAEHLPASPSSGLIPAGGVDIFA